MDKDMITNAIKLNKEGLQFFARKEYRKAADCFLKACELDSDNGSYLYNAGNAFLEEAVLHHAACRNEAKEYLQ